MLVKEIMTSKVEWVHPDLSIQECAQKMRDLNIGTLPVQLDGQLIGVITDRDICCRAVAEGCDLETISARYIMTSGITSCSDDLDCSDAVRLMEDKHVRRLAVLDKEKQMIGLLSVDDLARWSHVLAGEVLEAVAEPPHWP